MEPTCELAGDWRLCSGESHLPVGSISPGQNSLTNGVVIVFLDDLHIAFHNTPKLRTGLREATERLLAAGRAEVRGQ